MGPQLGVNSLEASPPELRASFEGDTLAKLSAEEAREWRAAAARAEEEGAYLWAAPYHCAAGRKPT